MSVAALFFFILVSSLGCRSYNAKTLISEGRVEAARSGDPFELLSAAPGRLKTLYPDPVALAKAQQRNQTLRSGKACQKLDVLWDAIWTTRDGDEDRSPLERDKIALFGNRSALGLWQAFLGAEDSPEIRASDRVRLTHRHGIFAQLRLVIDESMRADYSGHFQGNSCILARFSSAVSPASSSDRFTPAFAAKFFMDGPSESMVVLAQHSFGGQGKDMNYFAKPLSNRLIFEKGVDSGVGTFSRFFWTAQKFLKQKGIEMPDPRELAAEHLGTMTPEGQRVTEPKAPRFIYLLPADVPAFPSEEHDFREDFLALNQKMSPALAEGRVAQGIKIFLLYVSDEFTTDPLTSAKQIGYFETNSHFVVSDEGDQRIAFRHAIIPREAEDYASDVPKAKWIDSWFSDSCKKTGAQQADLEPNPLIAGEQQGRFIDSYIFKRGCGRDNFESNLGGL